jgi:Arc/MetJ-type ribon-helix-helix transcriptional regulator
MKTAISIPDEIYEQAVRAVEEGRAASVSGYFADLARRDIERTTLAELAEQWREEDGISDEQWEQARHDVEAAFKRAEAFFAARRRDERAA